MVKNPKLVRQIADAAWGELVRQLEYKAKWYGRNLVKIDRWFPSSKRCGSCGHILESLPLSVRAWDCPKCEAYHDRDINAARNILAVGHTALAAKLSGGSLQKSLQAVCGANVRPPIDLLCNSRSQVAASPDGHESKGLLRKTSNWIEAETKVVSLWNHRGFSPVRMSRILVCS